MPIPGKKYEANEFVSEFWRSNQYSLGDEMIDSKGFAHLNIEKGQSIKLALWNKEKKSVEMVSRINNDIDEIILFTKVITLLSSKVRILILRGLNSSISKIEFDK